MDILTVHRGKRLRRRAIPERLADGRITIKTPLTVGLREAWNDGKRFMSVEFFAIEERTVSGIRSINRALLVAAAMVVKPEYDTAATAELREVHPTQATLKRMQKWQLL